MKSLATAKKVRMEEGVVGEKNRMEWRLLL